MRIYLDAHTSSNICAFCFYALHSGVFFKTPDKSVYTADVVFCQGQWMYVALSCQSSQLQSQSVLQTADRVCLVLTGRERHCNAKPETNHR